MCEQNLLLKILFIINIFCLFGRLCLAEETAKNYSQPYKVYANNSEFPEVEFQFSPENSLNNKLYLASEIVEVFPNQDEDLRPPKLPEELQPNQPIPRQIPQPTELKKPPKKTQQQILLDALTNSADRYPWIVNPTDKLTFYADLFKPNEDSKYTDIDIRIAEDNPVVNKITFGEFPRNNQFYWVLEGNRVVIETQGWQGGVLYQGRSTETKLTQYTLFEQSFWGLQTVFNIPINVSDLLGEVGVNNFSIRSVAGEIINPEGIPAPPITINSGIDPNDPNVTILDNSVLNSGSGSTFSSSGGGALFQFLDAQNTPQIFQGFPTVNLQPLLDNGNVQLKEGEIIPDRVLQAAGISWSNPQTGEPASFTAPISSLPGNKIAQLGRFDNLDLLNILVNPYLSDEQRDYHYLNSLFWVSFGERDPVSLVVTNSQESEDWYRLYATRPHNRTIIEYDPVEIKATYSNVFANPGISLTFNFDQGKIDETQTLNSTFGLVLGGIFEFINTNNINESLQEARDKYENQETFSPLITQATSAQRRAINQRLNRALAYGTVSSGLEQLSGNITFKSQATPQETTIFQLRTGLHQRAVQFLELGVEPLIQGNTFFSNLRLSNEDFGPLVYVGNLIPLNQTNITPINQSFAAEVVLTNSDGRQFVSQFNSSDNTTVPINIGLSEIAFDYLEIGRLDRQRFEYNGFDGYLLLPAIEFLVAGSSGKFNYSANLGTWFNFDSNSAPTVSDNSFGREEPTLGLYVNTLLTFIATNIELDANNVPIAIISHQPFLRLSWNTAANDNNPLTGVLSYSYSRQTKNWGYSIAPGIAFIPDNSNGTLVGSDFVGIFNSEFSTTSGFQFALDLELGENIYFNTEALQRVAPFFSVGAYLKNSILNNIGLTSRETGLYYGFIMRHGFPDSNVFLETTVGTGDEGFDARLQGGYRF